MASDAQRFSPAGVRQGRFLRPGFVQYVFLNQGGDRVSRKGRPRGRKTRTLPLLLLRTFSREHGGVWIPCRLRSDRVVRTGRGESTGRAAAAGGGPGAARR